MRIDRTPDTAAAEIAGAHEGVIDRSELLGLGLSPRRIESWLARGRLHRLHEGVYALGHRSISHRGRLIAALRAAGPDAAICGRSGACIRGLSVREGPSVDVWVPSTGRRSRDGIVIHSARLVPAELRSFRGLPVVSLSYLLLQLASVVSAGKLDALMAEASHLGMTESDLEAQIERSRGKRGVAPLRLAAEGYRGGQPTRSVPEADFMLLCRRSGIPPPMVNVPGCDFEVDFLWPDVALIVDIDGFGPHRRRERFEGDRPRAVTLRLSGYEYLPFTPRQVRNRSEWVARSVASAYRQRSARA